MHPPAPQAVRAGMNSSQQGGLEKESGESLIRVVERGDTVAKQEIEKESVKCVKPQST